MNSMEKVSFLFLCRVDVIFRTPNLSISSFSWAETRFENDLFGIFFCFLETCVVVPRCAKMCIISTVGTSPVRFIYKISGLNGRVDNKIGFLFIQVLI